MTTPLGTPLLRAFTVSVACLLWAAGCTPSGSGKLERSPAAAAQSGADGASGAPSEATSRTRVGEKLPVAPSFRNPLPGMPPVVGNDVYAATRAGMMSPGVARDREYVYVPDSKGSTVTVISQRTRKVVRVVRTGYLTQHVTPSYDLEHLYANSSVANEFVELSPRTGRRVGSIPVPRPYNLYFTPDGEQAVVMVEQHDIIRFADPGTFRKRDEVSPPSCRGPNHADFSGNGRFMVVTCEFSGTLLKVGTLSHKVEGVLQFGAMSMPQDVRISPDGTTFYVADMGADVVRLIDARRFRRVGRIRLPADPHALYPSRDGKVMYVSNRGAGRVSVVSLRTRKVVDTWVIPGGGSPDMGGVSADGRTLWLSGRYDGEVYAFDTRTGKLVARVPIGGSPHGAAVWPQPGRFSLGHTGNMR